MAEAALRSWTSTDADTPPSDRAIALPATVNTYSPAELLAAAADPDRHPTWRAQSDFVVTAYRNHPCTSLPHDQLDENLAEWQRALARLLHPAVAQARSDVLAAATLTPPELTAAQHWLNRPPTRLLRPLTGAFVLDMHAARRRSVERTGAEQQVDNWFEHHLADLAAGGALDFLDRYPLLARQIACVTRNWASAGVEFARRLVADAAALAEWLDTDPLDVRSIDVELGDPHRQGRSVARLDLGGTEVAYKPTPLDVAAWLASPPDRVARVPAPDLLARKGYGWVRWLHAAPADEAGARTYFAGLGRLNPVAWMLGANDLHAENIIPGADGPILLDLETLLSPQPRHAHAGHDHAAPGILLESPVNTGLLPTSVALAPGEEMDASPFGTQRQVRVPGWAEPGTSDMRSTLVEVAADVPGVVTGPGGTPHDPFGHVDAVIAGSVAGFDALSDAANAWRSVLAAVPTPAPRVRVLLRDTALYGRILRYLEHPAVLHNPFLGDAAFDLLDPGAIDDRPAYQEAVLSAERSALLDGDVPYFEVAIDSVDLHLDDGRVLADFFAASPLARASSRLDKAYSDRVALTWVTSASLRAAQLNRDRRRDFTICCDRPPASPGSPTALEDAAVAIADRLCALVQEDTGEVSWLTMRVDDSENWRLVAADRSLYVGTLGIQLFFEALAVCGLATPEHASLLRVLRRQRNAHPVSSPAGVFDGVAGELFAEWCLTEIGAPAGSQPLAPLLRDVDVQAVELPDLLTGAAGIVLVLARIARRWPEHAPGAGATAARLVRSLVAGGAAQDVGLAWPVEGDLNAGFAHGTSGIGLAFEAFAATWPESPEASSARAAAHQARLWEDSIFDPTVGNWPDLRPSNAEEGFSFSWCNGSAGTGLSRAALLLLDQGHADRPRWRDHLQAALTATRRDGLGHGQSLCHGDLGLSELLLGAATATGQAAYAAEAARVGAMVAQSVLADHGIARADFAAAVDTPGLMSGSAGIGYQLLRLTHPGLPSLLTLGWIP